jgi:predicted ATPase
MATFVAEVVAVRIAFSGSHRVGKSSLLEAVAEALPGYVKVDEPYYQLEEDGYDFSAELTLEDFQAQLERSIELLSDTHSAARNVLFDRCPADLLAYLFTHEDAEAFESEELIEAVCEAMGTLDLVVFVPIEQPDRIALPAHEDRKLRLRVHKRLEQLLLDDPYDFGATVLEVESDLKHRLALVLQRVGKPHR